WQCSLFCEGRYGIVNSFVSSASNSPTSLPGPRLFTLSVTGHLNVAPGAVVHSGFPSVYQLPFSQLYSSMPTTTVNVSLDFLTGASTICTAPPNCAT